MSDLQDLIDIPLDEISDEELENLMIHGRLAREMTPETKARASRKPAASKAMVVDADDFE